VQLAGEAPPLLPSIRAVATAKPMPTPSEPRAREKGASSTPFELSVVPTRPSAIQVIALTASVRHALQARNTVAPIRTKVIPSAASAG